MIARIFIISTVVALGNATGQGIDFSKYPEAKEISYGTVTTQIQPEHYVKLKAPAAGRLYLKIRDGQHPKGTVWAEVEPKQLALERESMELARSLQKSKEIPAARLEMADARAALENRRDELKRNLSMVGEILAEPELAELYLGNEGKETANSRSTVEEMRGRLLKQIAALEDALEYVGTPEQERMELRLSEILLEKKETELTRRERESKLELPFGGEFRYLVETPQDLEIPIDLQSGDDIAEISDYGRLECHVLVNRPAIRQLPDSSLSLGFERFGSGAPLRAEFSRKETREVYGKPELVYIFRFSEQQAKEARSLIGGRASADLLVSLSSEARLVPKLDLVKAAPDLLREKGWRVGVEAAFPGWRAIAVGQSHVAMVSVREGDE